MKLFIYLSMFSISFPVFAAQAVFSLSTVSEESQTLLIEGGNGLKRVEKKWKVLVLQSNIKENVCSAVYRVDELSLKRPVLEFERGEIHVKVKADPNPLITAACYSPGFPQVKLKLPLGRELPEVDANEWDRYDLYVDGILQK